MRRVLDALDQYRGMLNARRHALLGAPTLVVGTIRGGTVSCAVPETCTIEVDRRLIPGEDAASVQAELEAVFAGLGLSPKPKISLQVEARPLETSPDERIVTALQRAVTYEDLAGGYRGWPAVSDAHLLANCGIPTVLFGPGDLRRWAHKPNERVSTAELMTAARVYCHLLGELLT
jgi:acetylornithine deacetylase